MSKGKIIKSLYYFELVSLLLKKREYSKYNNKLKLEAIQKRKLCIRLIINGNGEKIARYKKQLSSGEYYEWEEVINSDPFHLYSIF